MRLQLVFMGTADVSATVLRSLLENAEIEIAGVVTPPDRPRGRRQSSLPCAVKQLALDADLDCADPENVNAPESLRRLERWRPDVIVVVAYGQFLGAHVLALPPLGCLNVHFSLLPALRGAAPVQWAIRRGERETGVTIMRMDRGMDTGAVLAQRATAIGDTETAGDLQNRLATLGAGLLQETLPAWQQGAIVPRPQNDAHATLAPKLRKADGWIDWRLPAVDLARHVRAFNPWPGAYTQVPAGKQPAHRLGIAQAAAEPASTAEPAKPGEIVTATKETFRVATGRGMLQLLAVQPEGRRVMPAGAYLKGRRLSTGMILGSPHDSA